MIENMFDIVLRPIDLANLNGIVIPSQHAEAYFPLEDGQTETMLEFTDRDRKKWRFRYSYHRNPRGYVFSTGWKSFAKAKKLVAGETLSFHRAIVPDGPERGRKTLLIGWSLGSYWGHRSVSLVNHLIPGYSAARIHPSGFPQPLTRKKLRLFGVDIEVSSSGEASGEMRGIWCTSFSPAVIRDDGQSSGASPRAEMGASSSL